MTDNAFLDICYLTSGYGKEAVLQGISLWIMPGELVAVIGRNGVGKSTLVRTIIGLLKVRAGVKRLIALMPKLRKYSSVRGSVI